MKFMLRYGHKFASYFALFPLSIFVLYAFWGGEPDVARFKMAFTLSGSLAVLQLVWALFANGVIDRTVLGVNFYLVIGALCFYFDWEQVGHQYDHLRESGVIIAIALVGTLTTLASPFGFIGVAGPRSWVIKRSILLLGVALVGCVFSFFFRGNLVLSAALPIFAIQMTKRRLIKGYTLSNQTRAFSDQSA